MEITEQEYTREKCWSGAGGEVSAYKSVIALINKEAGEAFVRGRDEQAKLLRDLAQRIQKDLLSRAEDELDRFIHYKHPEFDDVPRTA